MIAQCIELLNSKPYYKVSKDVEIAKGLYKKGNYKKKLKRYIKNKL